MHTTPLRHRALSRRSVAAGLLAIPAAYLLAACAAGDSSVGDSAAKPEPTATPDETRVTEVLVLHHAQGLTQGIRGFADKLAQAGFTVHTPDLYDGRTFPTLDEGLAYARQIGLAEFRERGARAADGLPAGLVYVGFSLGVMPAQQLAQTRAGARGAVLVEACLPASEFGAWPAGVPVQVHGMDADRYFAGEGDIDAARALVAGGGDRELFVYRGDRHLFTDSSLPTYDDQATALVTSRVLAFLDRHRAGAVPAGTP